MDAAVHNGTLGFIGLGTMGSAMSRRALGAGVEVLGFDLAKSRRDEAHHDGVRTVPSITDLIGECAWIVTSLPSATAVLDVVGQLAESTSTKKCVSGIIETSTLSVDSKLAARRLADAGSLELFDCPLSGTGKQARAGDLVAYVSGREGGNQEAARTMAAFTRAQYDLGDFGNGTRMKLVANLLVAIHNVAAAEALVLAERLGLDLGTVLRAVGDGAGSSRMLEVRGPAMAVGDYRPTMRIDTFLKDLDIIAELAQTQGAPAPLFSVVHDLYQQLEQQGLSGEDTAAIHRALKAESLRGHDARHAEESDG